MPARLSKKNRPLTASALIAVLTLYYIHNMATLPHYADEYFAGIIGVYTLFPFILFGFAGLLVYLSLGFMVLQAIGRNAGKGHGGRYISAYILFVVSLDLAVYALSGNNGTTAVSLILAHPFNYHAGIPLLFMLLGLVGLVAKQPEVKSASAIFGATFILTSTIIFQ